MTPRYHSPAGGHPPQDQLLTDRAVFTESYAVIPRGTMRDIVTASALPFWEGTRLWVTRAPAHRLCRDILASMSWKCSPGGGSDRPETDPARAGPCCSSWTGRVRVRLVGQDHEMRPGGFAYLPPGSGWQLRKRPGGAARFHWIRKAVRRARRARNPSRTRCS